MAALHPDFHLWLDSADLDALRTCLPHPLVRGVTTNPTLLRRAGLRPSDVPRLLDALWSLKVRQVQVQVTHARTTDMLLEAEKLVALADPGQLVVKIPATRDGLAAGAELTRRGVPVTFTAVWAPEQALFAAMLGAAYAAPYLGRMEDAGLDGLAEIAKMQALVAGSAAPTRLLVASLRSRQACLDVMALGARAITIPPALFGELVDHEATRAAERVFLADAREI
ncbi:MAG: hypothetical protein RLZZ592_2620 [Pseudomonadota bacterium]|jgi:transaldolase|nr:transaldolase [Pseudomonadota bacterium]